MDKMESESNIDILFENNPVPMVISYLEKIIEVNAALLAATGFAREDLIGKTRLESGFWDNPEDYKKMQEIIEKDGQLSGMDFVLRQKDGKSLHVLYSAKMIEYNGRRCLLSAMMNVFELYEMTRKIEVERLRLQNVIEGTGAATWDLNMQTGSAVYNERWAEIIGYTLEELQPINTDTWKKYTHPDDISRVEELMQRHNLKLSEYFDAEFRMRHKNGNWVWIHARGKVMERTPDGQPVWVLGTQYDITSLVTEREKSAEFERFFAVNPELMAVLDRDANLIKSNSAWENVLGFSMKEIENHGYLDLVHPDDKTKTLDAISSLSGPSHQTTTVIRFRTHEGGYRYLEWHAQTFDHLVYATARDITQLTMDKISLRANLEMKEKHLELMNMEGITVSEFLDRTLEQVIAFTKSSVGYIFLYDSKNQEFSLHSWSRTVMDECKVEDPSRLYHLASVGLWGEVVRQKKPIIVNDYQAPSPMKKGYPEGHVTIRNFVSIPVFKNGDIVAVVAASNKSGDYTSEDVLNLELLMNTVWPVVERKKTEELLRNEKELLSTTLLTVGVGIVVTDKTGKVLLINPMAEQLTKFSKDEIAGRDFNEVFHVINLVTGKDAPNPVFELADPKDSRRMPKDLGIISEDGSETRIDGNTNIIRSDNREITGFVISLKDISREYEQEKEIEGFLNVNLDMLCVWDLDGNFHKVNRKFTEVTGYTMEEIEERSFIDLVHEEDQEAASGVLTKLANKETLSAFTNRVRCKDGSYKYIEWHTQPGTGKFLYSSARDITEKRRQTDQLRELADRDELTGLYNRHYFEGVIEEEMEQSDRYGVPLSMMMLDLDHFKLVNDTWGHPVGDEQLKLTARTMEEVKRDSDVLVRFGGEEFILLLRHTNKEGAVTAARKIRKGIEENRHPVTGTQTASIGVAERMKSESFRHWYRRVDVALYRAKETGRNRVVVSDENDRLSTSSVNIDWNIQWESGNEEIDQQHRELVDIGGRLINLSYEVVGKQEVLYQLDRLLNHLVEHFETEESILTQIGYPDLISHAAIHKDLVKKALQIKEDYMTGEIKASAFFSFVVDDVIYGHMVSEDTKYFPYSKSDANRFVVRGPHIDM